MKRGLKIGCLTVVILLALITYGISSYLISFALSPDSDKLNEKAHYSELFDNFPDMKPWVDSLKTHGALKDTFVIMPTGERHHAIYAAYPQGSRHTAVILHGWKDNAIKFLNIARFYYQQFGYNVLLPELHAHGQSEGEIIGMGWQERKDVLQWLDIATRMFHSDSLVVHGVSMGAATTMNVSGEKMPASVKDIKFVEDCGYTSVWDEFDERIWEDYSLPKFPFLYLASTICKIRNGWSFGEASPIKQLQKCHYPMLFIHGDSDLFVPSWMIDVVYKAKPDKKEIWITKGADHNQSYSKYPKEYVAKVREFLNKKW